MKNYTDLEQSKVLDKLLQKETSDMCYQKTAKELTGDYAWEAMLGQNPSVTMDMFSYKHGYVVPAWSLGKLIEIFDGIKKILEQKVTLEIGKNPYNKWYVGYVDRHDNYVTVVNDKELINACVKMVKKLKKYEII